MEKYLVNPVQQYLETPKLFLNLPLEKLFEIFGLKSQQDFSLPISIWANVNSENWALMEEICNKYLLATSENLVTLDQIKAINGFPPESPAKKSLVSAMKWLLASAATVEALRFKEIKMEVKNHPCFVKKGIERTNMRDALWTCKKILISDAENYCKRMRKYLLEDMEKQTRILYQQEEDCVNNVMSVDIPIVSPSIIDAPKDVCTQKKMHDIANDDEISFFIEC